MQLQLLSKDETEAVLPVVQSEAVVQVQTMEHHLEGPGIVLRQKTSECCRFFTCQPNIDWLIHPPHPHGDASDFGDPRFADTLAAKFWIQEDATYCNRVWSCWAPGCRETTYRTLPTSFAGTAIATDADSLMTHKKGGTCGVNSIVLFSDQGAVRCPMCCCLPFMDTLDNNGERLPVCQHHLLGHARWRCHTPLAPYATVHAHAACQGPSWAPPSTCATNGASCRNSRSTTRRCAGWAECPHPPGTISTADPCAAPPCRTS
jgi:hypothetical protein